MWLVFSVVALICWSGSDLFSKLGCRERKDKYGPLKMVMAVGLVMGLNACYQLFFTDVYFDMGIMLTYLPVSILYIVAMVAGYFGLRYIELSVSSPICNASGALSALVILIISGFTAAEPWQLIVIGLMSAGVIALGFIEAKEDPQLRIARQDVANFRYAKSPLALILPLAYCILDAAGTFADYSVLDALQTGLFAGFPDPEMAAADSANVAYQLTFLASGLFCFIYVVLIKKERIRPKGEWPKLVGAGFETVGQVAYIYALADTQNAVLAAPIISSYCVLSVFWGGIFLKERLSKLHYIAVFAVICSVVLLGIFDA